MALNLVDFGLLAAALVFLLHGYRKGAAAVVLEMSGLVAGLLLALLSYVPAARLLADVFGLPYPLGKPLSFLAVWAAAEIVVPPIFSFLHSRSSTCWSKSSWTKPVGALVAAVEVPVLAMFVLSLLLSFQFPVSVKQKVMLSRSGSALVRSAQTVESFGARLTGGSDAYESLAFSSPGGSGTAVVLWPSTVETFPDTLAEEELFARLNERRQSEGLRPLVMDQSLVAVARRHGDDMFVRGYLSSLTPEGRTPDNRATDSGIAFVRLTESLAHAPDVDLVFRGLTANQEFVSAALSSAHARVGVGVMNAGSRGRMFVLEFAD